MANRVKILKRIFAISVALWTVYVITSFKGSAFNTQMLQEIREPAKLGQQRFLEAEVLNAIILAGLNQSHKSLRMTPRISEGWIASKSQSNQSDFLVPNVVHYVWLGSDLTFTFIHYLSFLSVHRYILPSYIFVHGENEPSGKWWNRTVQDVDNIIHVHRVLMTHAPSGKPLQYRAHASDILSAEIIYKFGGIYLDADVIVLKSFDTLRRYRTVMGREHGDGICNAVIVGSKGAPFLRMLVEQYESYGGKNEIWSHRSVVVPDILNKIFPSFIHVEEKSINHPNCWELEMIYGSTYYNWSGNYAMHLWVRVQFERNAALVPQSVDDINCNNSTIGQIARHVYYQSEIMSSNCKIYHVTSRPKIVKKKVLKGRKPAARKKKRYN